MSCLLYVTDPSTAGTLYDVDLTVSEANIHRDDYITVTAKFDIHVPIMDPEFSWYKQGPQGLIKIGNNDYVLGNNKKYSISHSRQKKRNYVVSVYRLIIHGNIFLKHLL